MGDFGVTVGDPCGAGCTCAGRFVELEFGVRLPGVVEPDTDVSTTACKQKRETYYYSFQLPGNVNLLIK